MSKRDLIISISGNESTLKLWNVINWECISNIIISISGSIHTGNILNTNNCLYIIISNEVFFNTELIKVFDLKGNLIKEINKSNEDTYIIETYYDYKLSKSFIITGNYEYVKSYDFNENKVYHIYEENDVNYNMHKSLVIYNNNGTINLIESSCDGMVRIWNFHTGILLTKIFVCQKGLCGICLWNDKYLFAACNDKTIKLIDLIKGKIIKNYDESNSVIVSFKKIVIPEYGECLLTQGPFNCQIQLWSISK